MVVLKAAIAPTIIMPSTPRLRTPAFSATSSPNAAKSSGVAATITPRTMSMTKSIGRSFRRLRNRTYCTAEQRYPDRVRQQHIDSKQEEQEEALKHTRDRRGKRHGNL